MLRLAILPAIVAGCLIGWLLAALLYIRTDYESPFVAVLVLYLVVAWEIRWWHEIRFRLPLAIFGGATLAHLLHPKVYGWPRINYVTDMMGLFGAFGDVNWSLPGAVFMVLAASIYTPMSRHDAEFFRGLQRRRHIA